MPWIVLLFSLCAPHYLCAQGNSGVSLRNTHDAAYRVTERSDWSRYENGSYIGLLHREVRLALYPAGDNTGPRLYQGNFYILEETLRDMQHAARAVDDVIPVSFYLFPNGEIETRDDRGFPTTRGFPAYPEGPILPGEVWTAKAVRITDPLNEGFPVRVPIVVEYEFRGMETYRDVAVYRISARYATRFPGFPKDPAETAGPESNPLEQYTDERYFKTLQGSHQVDIILRASDGLPLLIRDTLDETFTWANGNTLRFRGFTLTFGEDITPLDAVEVIETITEKNGEDGAKWTEESNIEFEPVPGGVKLIVKDIRFVADSEAFLPEEYHRLDSIAEALKKITGRTFLVEGHTAAVGRPQAEMELSLLRSKRMVDELVKRGVSAERFLYKGWGGEKPLGDNSTEEGRALNRRVEITILD